MSVHPARLLRALAGSWCVVSAAACYSWQIGDAPLDGGGDGTVVDAGAHDAPDASDTSDANSPPPVPDADAAVDTAPPPVDAPSVDASDGGASCATLEANTAAARAAAIACVMAGPTECTTPVTDECGCSVFVAVAASSQTAAYTAAVATLKAAHCPSMCPASCPLPGQAAWFCLLSPNDAGTVSSTCTP